METGEEGIKDESVPVPHTQQLCRFFSQGRHCSFGKKCKFLHARDDAHEKKTVRTPRQSDVTPPNSEELRGNVGHRHPPANNSKAAPAAGRRPCRYFISGHCTMEDRCRFWHPPQFPPVDELHVPGGQARPAQRMPPVSRPSVLQDVKLCDLTEDVAKQLRDTEITQLKKRFPKDQLIIQERSDGKVTYYRAAVEPTDPDWPFDLKEIDIMVSFPDNYPQEIFTLDVPLDQNLPPVMARHVQQASLEWLQAKHATNQLLGKVELLFRPFLRWLDRSLERLFTEGARQLKKDIDLEKAGLQFIPYQELQATVCEKSDHSSDPASDTAAAAAAAAADADEDAGNDRKLEKTEGERSVEGGKLLHLGCDEEQEEEEESSHLVENIKISDPRRGTEVKLLGLRLGENTATVVAQQITVCLQCNRCKVTADLTLTGRTACTAQCEKCSSSINAAFRPCMLHHYSDVLGYLDLHNAAPADLVLQDCELAVGCLSCSQECPAQKLSYGQAKEFNCEHCHSKLSVLAESTRFQYIQPRTNKTASAASSAVNYKTIRDPAVQKGKPLPEKGTCKHYKQSHRWLRFPCCGRAYPCDACHDEDQDHPMELATRMICGYCAKEQVLISMETGEEGIKDESVPVPHTQQLCRFFSQGRHCSFGKKCKFLHARDDAHEKKTVRTPRQSDVTPPNSEELRGNVGHRHPPANNSKAAPAAGRRPCRYFISGHCTMEDRCRFWHPPQFPPVDELHVPGGQARPAQRMPPVSRPSVLQDVKLCDLTEDVAKQLRDTEITQLKKRFPKDQLIIQERSDGKVTYYRAAVEPTDPDWPFDLKEIDIMVSFPDNYPQEIFTLDVPLDQNLPPVMARHVQQASLEWLQAKHATNQLLGKVELLFRPFLRWLDRSLERLFTEGARQLKKDIDLEKAGLQFIPYQELQATVCEKSDHSSDPASDTAAAAAAAAADADEDAGNDRKLEKTEGERSVEGGKLLHLGCDEEQEEEEESSHLVENIKISDPRRGTEVKLLGLRLGENTATVVAQQITVCLQCNRCKVTADLTLTGRTACTAQCEKCSSSINAAFRPCMLHHYSDVLGYLDLHNAAPADLVLQDCELAVGCLSCSQECPAQKLSYGQAKEFNCEHCHSKLSVLAESTRFQYIQPRTNKTASAASSAVNYKTIRDPAVQKGKPLPEKGTCKHYKQSHRWLRFPCCGRAYPCDACHDEDQDHPMELATRMICGYCAKEQPYGNGKPCVSCGSMMTRGTRSSHWEGGLGCRNKGKMSRNDRQKYANTNKTISRKAASEKK